MFLLLLFVFTRAYYCTNASVEKCGWKNDVTENSASGTVNYPRGIFPAKKMNITRFRVANTGRTILGFSPTDREVTKHLQVIQSGS